MRQLKHISWYGSTTVTKQTQMNCSRMQLSLLQSDMLHWHLMVPDTFIWPTHLSGCISSLWTYTTHSAWDCVFRLCMLISAISFAWNKAKCLAGFTVPSCLRVMLSLMKEGLWWAMMTKMQGRPPQCLSADSSVTEMKHIWVFYRLKRKYNSTNFSHITIYFVSSPVLNTWRLQHCNLLFPTVLLILCIVFDLLAYYLPQSASWQQHWHTEGSFKHSGENEQQQPTLKPGTLPPPSPPPPPPLMSNKFHHLRHVFQFHHTYMFSCCNLWAVQGSHSVTAGLA